MMQGDCSSYDDAAFWELLPGYDQPEWLLDWYYCFEEDPLPVPETKEDGDE